MEKLSAGLEIAFEDEKYQFGDDKGWEKVENGKRKRLIKNARIKTNLPSPFTF